MRLDIKKRYILEILGILLYKFLLDMIYIFFIQNNINYWGFDIDINSVKLIESYLLIILMYLMIPKKQNKVSTYIMQFQYLTIYIPLMSLYGLENHSRIYAYMVTSMFLIMFTSLNRDIYFNLKPYKFKKKHLYVFLYMIIVVTILGLIKSGLLPTLKSFNFKNVYIIRKSIHLDSITAYLIGITTRVVIPFLLCINYSRKKYKKIFMLIILQLIIYSMYPFKSILFSLGLVIIVINGVKSRNFFKNFIYTLIVLCMVSIILELFSNDGILTSLFIRRSLFVPVNIQFDYNNFFTNNPYLYMSNNSIGSILGTEYPYRLPIVNLISAIYYNDPRMAANTCYISESYAQLGYLGMLLYSAIFILINRCLDWMVLKVDKSIIIPTLIFAIYALNDASLLTTMLTHGLIPGMLIIYMYMGTEDCKNKLIE